MSDQKLSKEPSDGSQRKAKGGAPEGNEFAVKHGGYRDEKIDALRAKSKRLNAAKRSKAEERQRRRARELRRWKRWAKEVGLSDDPATRTLIRSIVRSEMICADLETYLSNRTPDSAIEALRLFTTTLNRLTDDATALLKLTQGGRFGESDGTPLTSLILASYEREAAQEAQGHDQDHEHADGLDEASVDLGAVDDADEAGGRGARIHGATPDDDAQGPHTSAPISETDSTNDTHKKDLKVTPTIEVGCNVKTRDPYSDPRHPANRWVRGDDLE